MTTLILDWSDWEGPASGWVSLTRVTWRRDPDTYQVPWTRQVRVEGRAVVDVQGMAGEVLAVTWAPDGGGRRTDHVLVPAEGEHLAHLLERVDPATLEPLPEGMPSAVDLVARTEALVARIESGEFTGDDGVGVESITDEDGDGVATVRLTSGEVSDLPLPRGPQGERGERGLTGEQGVKGDRGDVGPAPEVSWAGDRLTVGGQTGPALTGPQGLKGDQGTQGVKGDQGDRGPQGLKGDRGDTGPANALTIGTVTGGTVAGATLTGEAPAQTLSLVLPQGAKGDRGDVGPQGPPGVVSSASSYVIVGPGRPDQPSTTAGTITGAEPVGAEYRSTDGANVGAYVWMKRPGNVWAVTGGDTGWRNITSLSSQLTSGTFRVRRMGDVVNASFDDAKTSNASGDSIIFLPDGFRASANYLGALYGYASNTWGYSYRVDNLGSLRFTAAPAIWIRDSRQWVTAQAWPTSLPGTPA